jgi:hypothetical protein
MIDREIYFDQVRATLFSGAMVQEQVDGQNAILSLWEWQATGSPMSDERWLAYMLATAYHETAQTMWPIEESGKGAGHDYGQPDPETGQTYYGRGLVQLTWKTNYDRATKELALTGERDLVWHPEKALDLVIASRIMFRGMSEGWFTGAKLGQFFNADEDDPIDARTIVNGHDCDEQIAGYHHKFLDALDAAAIEAPAGKAQTLTYRLIITAPAGDVSIEVEQLT